MEGLLATLVVEQLANGFVICLRHQNVGGVRARINDAREPLRLSVEGLCCGVNWMSMAISFRCILIVWKAERQIVIARYFGEGGYGLTLAVSGRRPNVAFRFSSIRKRAAGTSTASLGG